MLKLFKRAPHFSGPGVSPSNRGQGLRLFFEVLELQSGIIRCIRTGGAWHLQCHAVATQKVKFHQLRVLTVLVSFLCLESARRIASNKMSKHVHLLMPLSLYVHCALLWGPCIQKQHNTYKPTKRRQAGHTAGTYTQTITTNCSLDV